MSRLTKELSTKSMVPSSELLTMKSLALSELPNAMGIFRGESR